MLAQVVSILDKIQARDSGRGHMGVEILTGEILEIFSTCLGAEEDRLEAREGLGSRTSKFSLKQSCWSIGLL